MFMDANKKVHKDSGRCLWGCNLKNPKDAFKAITAKLGKGNLNKFYFKGNFLDENDKLDEDELKMAGSLWFHNNVSANTC